MHPAKPIRSRSRARDLATITMTLGAAGSLVWRLSPILEGALPGLRRRRERRRTPVVLAGLGGVGLAAIFLARWQLPRLFTSDPEHQVELRRGRFEIRSYPETRVVETTVDTSWNEALDRGFRRLADFLVGANASRHELAVRPSPVLGTGDREGFHVSFLVPEGIPVATPDDERIDVHLVPPRRVAVLRFSGRHDASTIAARKRELARALVEHRLKPRGEAMFAAYDPPWTLPLLRRNELWVEVENENEPRRHGVSVEA